MGPNGVGSSFRITANERFGIHGYAYPFSLEVTAPEQNLSPDAPDAWVVGWVSWGWPGPRSNPLGSLSKCGALDPEASS